jgi:hypothetical protein
MRRRKIMLQLEGAQQAALRIGELFAPAQG